MNARYSPIFAVLLSSVACLQSTAAPAQGQAMVVAVTTLPELIEEADLACLCTIEAFHMMPDRTQTADSPFRVSVGLEDPDDLCADLTQALEPRSVTGKASRTNSIETPSRR